LQNVTAALTGAGAAPFPVKTSTLTRLRLLQVVPFAFKYTSTVFDRWRLRPYALAGFGTYVTIHSQNPARGNPPGYGVRSDANLPPDILAAVNSFFGGQAPFGGPLVAGQISQAAELEARGLPGGHGNLDFGLQTGGGVEFRISRNLSLGFDARFNKIAGSYGDFRTIGSRVGFHF
jgi:opacity protein-like surface antigen